MPLEKVGGGELFARRFLRDRTVLLGDGGQMQLLAQTRYRSARLRMVHAELEHFRQERPVDIGRQRVHALIVDRETTPSLRRRSALRRINPPTLCGTYLSDFEATSPTSRGASVRTRV